jgi:hypothetical protein
MEVLVLIEALDLIDVMVLTDVLKMDVLAMDVLGMEGMG